VSGWKRETTWRLTVPVRGSLAQRGWAAGWLHITRVDGDDTYRWEVVLVDVEGVAASGSTSVNFTAAKAQAMQGYKEACDKLEKVRGGA
jgi:hypothetical protein